MSGIRLSLVQALPDPAPAWKWVVRMPVIFGNVLSPVYVEELQLPFNNTSSQPRYAAGSRVYYPDMTDVQATSLTFYEDINYSVFTYMYGWRSLVVDPNTGYYGLPYGGVDGGYKKRISWELYDGVNIIPALTGYLAGCWPTELQALNLNFTSSERVRIQQTFSVDSSVINIASASPFVRSLIGTGLLSGLLTRSLGGLAAALAQNVIGSVVAPVVGGAVQAAQAAVGGAVGAAAGAINDAVGRAAQSIREL